MTEVLAQRPAEKHGAEGQDHGRSWLLRRSRPKEGQGAVEWDRGALRSAGEYPQAKRADLERRRGS